MDPLLEQTLVRHVIRDRRSARRKLDRARVPSRFERWIWAEIPAYRASLVLSYAGSIYFGISSFIAGIPAFDIGAPDGWTPIWASVVAAGGFVGAFGTISESPLFRRIELAGAWALFVTFVAYAGTLLSIAYGAGDPNRAAAGAGFCLLMITPGIRMVWLMAQVGRKKPTHPEE